MKGIAVGWRSFGKNRGFTLTEVIIAMVMGMIILSTIIMIFSYSSRAYDYASFSFSISRETSEAIQWLRKELTETSLGSIRVYPSKQFPAEKPGFSFASAYDPDLGGFQFSEAGTPRWDRFVFYSLIPDEKPLGPGLPRTGTLYRWVQLMEDPWAFPLATSVLPSKSHKENPGDSIRPILRHVVLPDQDLDGDSKADEYEGFRIMFLRKRKADSDQEIFSATNPVYVTDDDSDNQFNDTGLDDDDFNTATNTRMIQVNLTVMELSDRTGEPNYFMVNFRVSPRN